MPVYMFYLFVGPFLWAAQVIAVIALAALGWRAPAPGWPASLSGRSAAAIAAGIAVVFALLMTPVALMVALRRTSREFPTHWTDGPGLACIAQAILLVATVVNAALVHRPR